MAEQTNPVDVEEAVPSGPLGAWIAANVASAQGPVQVTQLAGGSSNLTFRVRDDANDWVLRRPPLRHVLATAHDMTREHTVQAALQGTDVPVAPQVGICEDESVIGAPFYLMQRLDGVVYDDVDAVAGITEAQALGATHELADVLAHLHTTDYEKVGLGEFGRPAGFMERQLRRWKKQWDASVLEPIAEIDAVATRLEAMLPPDGRHGIVHGDYSFNNTMFRADDPTKMLALLDWEMSTLGDPLSDVGTLLVYWGEVGERMWRSRQPQAHRANAGFPDADTLLARYQDTSGIDVGHIDFYKSFAVYKLAVISQGAAKRISLTDPERAAGTVESVRWLAETALRYAGG
ncbi:MAG: phosphotransferase family protein [Acidimicrobiia bacterium]